MLSLFAALVAAKTVAVVPIAGALVTATELNELAPVDDSVRAAVPRDDVTLQSREQTTAALQSARSAGVWCTLLDDACWKKAAALCDVELLVIPSATLRADGDVALVITLVDASHETQRIAGVVGRKDDGRTKTLVDDAFMRLDAPVAASSDSDPPAPAAEPIVQPVTPSKPPDETTLILGASVGAGAVVGVVAAAVTSWIVITAPPKRHQP